MNAVIRSWTPAVWALCAVASAVGATDIPDQQSAPPDDTNGATEEIVVTARRREENLQQTPISATVLDAKALEAHSVQTLQDLQEVSPGLRVQGLGANVNVVISLRGMTRAPSGEGASAVVPYFAEVPLASEGSVLPTFDLANVQVLKGPQGTLFGRNTTGGAVLITPQAPTYDWSSYLRAGYGNLDYYSAEGAFNVPVVSDKLAIRISGQIRRRDGYTQNVGNGQDLNGTHSNALRASVRFDPLKGLSNTAVFDYTSIDESAPAAINIAYDPDFFNAINPFLAATYNPFLASQVQQQQGWGPHKTATTIDPYNAEKLWGVTNTTRYDLGRATLKNIFGYRAVQTTAESDVDGLSAPLPAVALPSPPYPPGSEIPPTPLFIGNRVIAHDFLSDELQILGSSFDDQLSWIGGAFYSKDEPDGINGSRFLFLGSGDYQSAYTTVENEAVFGQLGWKLSRWVNGLSIDLGLRRNWDQTRGCGVTATDAYASSDDCFAIAASNTPTNAGVVTHNGNSTTWTLGLNYQFKPNLFAYAISRRGYREGGVNLPLFRVTPGTGSVPTTDTKDVLGQYQTYGPEKVTDIELGFKSDWLLGRWRARFNAAAFHTNYQNAQVALNVSAALYSPLNPNGPIDPIDAPQDQSVYYNGGHLTIQGIDVDAAVSPLKSLTFSFSGNYVDQKIDSRVPVSPVLSPLPPSISTPTPRASYTLGVTYKLPLHPLKGDLIAGADYFSTDSWQILDTTVSGYHLVNARLDWKNIAGRDVDLGAFVRNALDADYVTGGGLANNNLPVRNVFYGEPRVYGAELTVHFGS